MAIPPSTKAPSTKIPWTRKPSSPPSPGTPSTKQHGGTIPKNGHRREHQEDQARSALLLRRPGLRPQAALRRLAQVRPRLRRHHPRHPDRSRIPDDHDVGQANLWGAGGKKSHTVPRATTAATSCRSSMSRMVERAQTSHLPDPYDPTPIQRGIGVYYTAAHLGRDQLRDHRGPQIQDRARRGSSRSRGRGPDHIRSRLTIPRRSTSRRPCCWASGS